jgi:5-methylcytosine-specific restriction endonuclease McrA
VLQVIKFFCGYYVMGKFIDLTGKKFGKLTVISRDPEKGKWERIRWNCLCDCGKKTVVIGDLLRKGDTKSCGCLKNLVYDLLGKKLGKVKVLSRAPQKKGSTYWNCLCDCGRKAEIPTYRLVKKIDVSCPMCAKKETEDLTGKVFGQLTVLHRVNKNRKIYWKCLCTCGKTKLVYSGALRSNSTKNCGCFKQVHTSKKLINILGQRFGKLIVISRSIRTDVRKAMWECLCDCGGKIITDSYSLRIGCTKSCGCLKNKFSDKTLASKNNLYYRYRKGAKNRKIPFSIEFKDFIELTQQNCYYCGAPPSLVLKLLYAQENLIYNGLDRLNGDGAYTLKNVVSCCSGCNRLKWKMGRKEFFVWLKKCYKNMNLGSL